MPDFSLILATSGRTTELHRFFSSLEVAGGNCECLVVDQNSDERLLPILAAWKGRLPIKHLKSPPGLSRARNVGLAAATGEIVAFPDDDCWYSPGLLEEVRWFFSTQSEYNMLSAGVRDETGTPSGNRWVRDCCDLGTANLFRTSVGMALFVRRDRAESFRFDESLGVGAGTRFASGEDTDYVFRHAAGGIEGQVRSPIDGLSSAAGYVERRRECSAGLQLWLWHGAGDPQAGQAPTVAGFCRL